MVIDTSAVVAIFFNETEREDFLSKIQGDSRRLIGAGNLLEMQIVLGSKRGRNGLSTLLDFVSTFQIEVVALDREQSELAGQAFVKFGKGRHKASLNFGDCMAYALASKTGEPLLFKGNDFSQTDVLQA